MTKLDDLITELCPDGVVYEKLSDICQIQKGQQLNKDLLLSKYEDGLFPVINGGIYPSGYWKETNFFEGAITISQGGASAGYVNFIETKFWAGAHCFVITKPKQVVIYRFLYYILKNNQEIIMNSKIGAGIPGLNITVLNELKIPIPPLEVQEEIVRILDSFSKLQTEFQRELEKELKSRKEQYEYYRCKLLSFDDSIPFVKIQNISRKISSGGTPDSNKSEYYNGDIPWLRTQEIDWKDITDTEIKITNLGLNESSAKMIPKNCVIVAMYGATAGKAAINKIPLSTNQACCNIEVDEDIATYRYVYHWICKEYENIKSLGQGSQHNINAGILKKYPIPLPPLSEQKRIVSILDRFDALCNYLTQGLSEEIESRKKQYEYYRDRLLTFKQKGVSA